MANFSPRKDVAAARLRNKLRRNRESLADQFEFKMFVVIDFKVQSKKTVIFEVDKVYPMMTNDYEEKMTKEMEKSEFSKESSLELLAKDVVQLHARNWHCKRRDVVGCSEQVDFMIWPRNDVQSIRCHLFSRWKHETKSPFKPCMASFSLSHSEYAAQLLGHRPTSQQSSCVLTNSEQSMLLFLSCQSLETSRGPTVIYRMHSLCVNLPQVCHIKLFFKLLVVSIDTFKFL